MVLPTMRCVEWMIVLGFEDDDDVRGAGGVADDNDDVVACVSSC